MNSGNEFWCSICQKQFSRQEHLRRHSLIHTNKERHQCDSCSKSFLRKDALLRHKTSHEQGRSISVGRGRACSSCAAAKVRCSGDSPCKRCATKGLTCSHFVGNSNRGSVDVPMGMQTHLASQSFQQGVTSYDQVQSQNNQHLSPSSFNTGPSRSLGINHVTADTEEHIGDNPPILQESRPGMPAPYAPDPSFPFLSNSISADDLAFEANYWNSGFVSDINWLPVNPNFSYDDLSVPFFQPSLDAFSEMQEESPIATQHTRTPASQSTQEDASVIASCAPIYSPKTTASRGSGEYYVDGDAARLPRVKRRKVASRPISHHHAATSASFSLKYPHSASQSEREILEEAQYEKMKGLYQQLCLEPSVFFQTFEENEFPPQRIFDAMLAAYFENFHPIMPFLDEQRFRTKSQDWRLQLAVATIGSQFFEGEGSENFASSMSEFLARTMLYLEYEKLEPRMDDLVDAQVRFLHVIGILYGSRTKTKEIGLSNLSRLASFCRKEWQGKPDGPDSAQKQQQAGRQVSDWRLTEERRRTGFSIWILDSMCAFHFQQPPFLKLEDAIDVVLPCAEELWSSESTEPRASETDSDVPTLLDAVQNLYIDKRLLAGIGEFSRIILIHSLFHRTWEVAHYIRQGMSRFEPIAEKRCSADIQPPLPIWPPAVALFNRWRNSACDCLDILHWSANAKIGAASGMEHPTVLHLHLARVVLLTPIDNIVRYVQYLTKSGSAATEKQAAAEQAQNDKNMIQRWAFQDQYKSRLAAIHAGVLFWHVRKYSNNAFYEPTAVALACLMLWAFTAFSGKHQNSAGERRSNTTDPQNGHADSISGTTTDRETDLTADTCDIILLDRPTDDELVQQFVRQGDMMHANMSGVGDLWGSQGAQKVLLEGHKILDTLGSWKGSVNYWMKVLEKLRQITISTQGKV